MLVGVGAYEVLGVQGVDHLEYFGLLLLGGRGGRDEQFQSFEDFGQVVLLDKAHEDSVDLLEVAGLLLQGLRIEGELLPELGDGDADDPEDLVQDALLLLGLLLDLVRQLLVLVQQDLVLADQLYAELLQLLLVFLHFLQLLGQAGLMRALGFLILVLLGALVPIYDQTLAPGWRLLPTDHSEGLLLSLHEILVAVHMLGLHAIEGVAHLAEVVHVELADEGVVVGVFEVAGQDLLAEAAQVQDDEGVLLGRPADDGLVACVLSKGGGTESME